MSEFKDYMAGLRAQPAEKNEGVSRQVWPERETRPQAHKEASPDYFQRTREREGNSPFSGGWAGGGTFAGRSR
jgi:hypothetical protein